MFRDYPTLLNPKICQLSSEERTVIEDCYKDLAALIANQKPAIEWKRGKNRVKTDTTGMVAVPFNFEQQDFPNA